MTQDSISKGTAVVVSLSAGTVIVICGCCLALCLVIACGGVVDVVVHETDHHQKATPVRDVLKPGILKPKGATEDIGPLNSKALNEEKIGIISWLRDRAYARRHADCLPCPQPVYPIPLQPDPVRPGPVNPDFIQPNYTRPVVVPPLDCLECQRAERKTGGYVCAHCRKPQVGEQWHTEWLPNGDPLTYLCEKCWSGTTAEQKKSIFAKWSASK